MLDLNKNITFRLARVAQAFANQATYVLKQQGEFNLSEWRVMVLLNVAGVNSPAMMMEKTGFDKALISRSLKQLQNNHMVTISPDPSDGRKQIVALTDKGKKAFIKTDYVMRQRQSAIREEVSEEQLEQLFSTLDIMYEVAQKRDFDEQAE